MVELKNLLEVLIEKKASDLHITTGSPPVIRVDGKITRLNTEALTARPARAHNQQIFSSWTEPFGAAALWREAISGPARSKRNYPSAS